MIVMTVLAVGCAAAEVTVPKDATEIEPGVYKHTDSAGKTYRYKKTPFGVVKSPEKEEKGEKSAPPAESTKADGRSASTTATPFGDVKTPPAAQAIKVSDRGDSLEFERPSPFGTYKWKRKKEDLNQSEREAWDRSRQPTTAAPGPKE
jgi:hypothetical protein